MENLCQELLTLFLPKEIDWKRYKLEKVVQIEDNDISPFVGSVIKKIKMS